MWGGSNGCAKSTLSKEPSNSIVNAKSSHGDLWKLTPQLCVLMRKVQERPEAVLSNPLRKESRVEPSGTNKARSFIVFSFLALNTRVISPKSNNFD